MADPRVLVMMATYNGGNLLTGQIDSILAQEDVDVTLLISDDGSTDGTAELCETYARRLPNVSFTLNDHNKGFVWNFLDPLYEIDPSHYDYFAFADQDDLWNPDKLQRAVERLTNQNGPALYYSNVDEIDIHTQEHREFPRRAFWIGHADELGYALIANWASGCTMVFNQALLELVRCYRPNNTPAAHDIWLHQLALAFGTTIADLEYVSMTKQFTGDNATGHESKGRFGLNHLKALIKIRKQHAFPSTAKELLAGYGDLMSEEDRELVSVVATLDTSWLSRIRAFREPRLKRPDPRENMRIKLRMLLGFI